MNKQSLHQRLLQKLSPQQIKLMKLIQLSTLELEDKIDQEIELNPALENKNDAEDLQDYNIDSSNDIKDEDTQHEKRDVDIDQYISDDEIPSYKLYSNNSNYADQEVKEIPFSGGESLFDLLKKQLGEHKLTDKKSDIGNFVIGCINDDGYLTRDAQAISDDLIFSKNLICSLGEIHDVLEIVQSFDPPGIGAIDLRECLVLQLKRKEQKEDVKRAILILERKFIEFTNKHYSKICDSLKINLDQLKLAIKEIEKLNPKPGGGVDSTKYVQRITPDFSIQIEDEQVNFTLNSRNAPSLRINKEFSNLLLLNKEKKGDISKSQKEALLFTKQKLDSARWFINAIYQRQQTLILTMSTILEIQKDYFLFVDEKDLKPMILKDVAEKTNLDISTISRVVNSKYVETPYGTFSLRHFFSESIARSDGESISVKEVKNIITELIKSENTEKPLNDQKLVDELNKKGYKIARRTVAKYREQMNFPVARLRKKIS